ncbi:hypothetical protein GCM10022254_52460 [Actinomadura meridiana]|uniref:HTH cro/C1-type domain-containing protein n=1 Tax=Actinomadura meridiana TaxID=559626 RepID=A0ABP8CDW4_9ACTN
MDDEIRHPLAYARTQRGWSQEELAKRIRQAAARRGLRSGTRGSRIYKWETGRAIPDQAESQPLIAEAFGIDHAAVIHLGWPNWLPGQDQPLPFGLHNAIPSLREALMTSPDRRSFLTYTTGALAALAHQWARTPPRPFTRPTPPTIGASADGSFGKVGLEMVAWLEDSGADLIRLATEHQQPCHQLLDAHLATVTDILSHGTCPRPATRRMHTLAASLATAIAWQRFDARRHAAAARFWHAALHNAHTAGQHDLGAGILSDLAYQMLWLNQPRTAANILGHAIPRTRNPTARSLLHLRQARAFAGIGENRRCLTALTAAEKALAAPTADPAPAWCSWMSNADIAADTGRCLADLGQRPQAHQLMNEGITLLRPTRSKTRAVYWTYQAQTYLKDGEPEIAADAATRSLELASRIDAPRCIAMVRDLEPQLAPYARITEVDELLQRLRAS